MRKLFVAVFLFSIIFISGCTTPGGFGEKYCSAIGICDVKEKEVEIPDIVVIKKIDIPLVRDGRIGPNRDVDIFVTLENKDVNKIITLTYVGINPGIFTCKEPENCEYSGETIGPGQDRVFSFKVTSPNNPGTIAIPGHLEFSVKYKYTSTRLATMTYITENTYIQYAKSGKEIPVQIINVPSDGPVELYLDISKIKQPVIVGDEGAKLSGMFAKPKITGGIVLAATNCNDQCKEWGYTGGYCSSNKESGHYCSLGYCYSGIYSFELGSDECINYCTCYTEEICSPNCEVRCKDSGCTAESEPKPTECKCADGTPCDQCVAGFKPKYCDATGNMVDNCRKCGCPADKPNCQSDGSCTTKPTEPSNCPYLSCEGENPVGCLCGEALTTSQHLWCCAAGNDGWGYLASDKESCQQAPECAAKTSEPSEPEKPAPKEEGKYQIYLEVMNKGSGEIDKISPGKLTIQFEEMELGTCSEEFGGESCSGSSVSNIKDIVVRGKKPFKYYFSFDPSDSIKDKLTGDKLTVTKKIEAKAEYIYRISKPLDILVSPRAEY